MPASSQASSTPTPAPSPLAGASQRALLAGRSACRGPPCGQCRGERCSLRGGGAAESVSLPRWGQFPTYGAGVQHATRARAPWVVDGSTTGAERKQGFAKRVGGGHLSCAPERAVCAE